MKIPQGEAEAVVADPVEDLGGSVHLDAVAGRHEDQAEGGQDDADEVTNRAAQDVKNLGERELGDTSNDAAHDHDGGSQGVLVERGSHIGAEGTSGSLLHGVDKVYHVVSNVNLRQLFRVLIQMIQIQT